MLKGEETINSSQMSEQEFEDALARYSNTRLTMIIDSTAQTKDSYTNIQHALSNLTNLLELQIVLKQNTILDLLAYRSIASAIKNLTKLYKFSIIIEQYCFMKDDGLIIIKESLQCLVDLRDVTIQIKESNFITSVGVKALFDSFQQLPNLTHLQVQIYEKSFESNSTIFDLFQAIQHLQNLEEISIAFDLFNVHEEDIRQLFEGLRQLKKVQKLEIDFQQIQSKSFFVEMLTTSLSQLVQLRKLVLKLSCDFSFDELDLLASFFVPLKHLEELNMDYVQESLFRTSFEKYIASLSTLTNLRIFPLFNILPISLDTKQRQIQVGQCFKALKLLEKVSIILKREIRGYYDEMLFDIAEGLSQMNNIQLLNLKIQNNISNNCYEKLSQSFKNLEHLKELCLSFISYEKNQIVQQNMLLNELYHFTALSKLTLCFNNLEITQFRSDLSLQFLQSLNLYYLEFYSFQALSANEIILLGKGLQSQSNLNTLKLNLQIGQHFDLDCQNSIGKGFKNLQNLKQLELLINFEDYQMEFLTSEVISELKYLVNLEELKFVNQQADPINLIPTLSDTLSHLIKLQKLIIEYQNECTIEYCMHLFNGMQNMINLRELDIKLNCLSGEELEFSFDWLKKLVNLSTINYLLQLQQYNSSFMPAFSSGLQHLTHLSSLTLNFGYNYLLRDQDIPYLAECFEHLPNLNHLEWVAQVDYDKLTTKGIQELSKGISHLKKLKSFKWEIVYHNLKTLQIFKDIASMPSLNNINCIFFQTDSINLIKDQLNQPDSEISEINQGIEGEERITTDISLNKNCKKETRTSTTTKIKMQVQGKLEGISTYIEDTFSQFKYLNTLDLLFIGSYYSPSDISDVMHQLGLSFQHFQYLQSFNMFCQFINFNLSKASSFSRGFKSLINLKSLDLLFNSGKIENNDELFSGIKYLHNLNQLNIKVFQVKLTDRSIVNLGQCLKSVSKLQFLKINLESIDNLEEGAVSIGKGLEYLQQLQYFNFRVDKDCNMGSIGAAAIGQGISCLSKLDTLQLIIQSNNNIGKSDGGIALAKAFRHMEFMQSIFIQIHPQNQLGIAAVDEFIRNISKIQIQETQYVHLSLCEDIHVFPAQIQQFLVKDYLNLLKIEFSDPNNMFQSTISMDRKYGSSHNLLLDFDDNINQHVPSAEIDILKYVPKHVPAAITFKFQKNDSNTYFTGLKQKMEQIQTHDLKIQITNKQLFEVIFSNVIEPLTAMKNLTKLTLIFDLEIQMEKNDAERIGHVLSKLTQLTSLRLQIIRKNNQANINYFYDTIIKQLVGLKKLNSLTLLSIFNDYSQQFLKYCSFLLRLVSFQISKNVN